MRNIKRVDMPQSLRENAKNWTDQLLNELKKGETADKTKVKMLAKKYDQKDVRAALSRMYKFCCYCESRVRHVTTDHIEHRKPQARFPQHTFDWDNLHLACPICNRSKSDDWDNDYPILDAVNDIPIDAFLSYKKHATVPTRNRSNPANRLRGETTIQHANLNRPELIEVRETIYQNIIEIIEEFNTTTDMTPSEKDRILSRLDELSTAEFGSYVKYLTDTYLRN